MLDYSPNLGPGKDILTLMELLNRAAEFKGLTIRQGATWAQSEKIISCRVTGEVLKHLAERKIVREPRPDCREEILTLVDENPQDMVPGYTPSNYWNFKLVEENKPQEPVITLRVGFVESSTERGVVLRPLSYSTLVSPADPLPNFRMFKAIVEFMGAENVLPVAQEIAASNEYIVVTWTDLGLGGIRRLDKLFEEFARKREQVLGLKFEDTIFNPVPDKRWEYDSNHNPGLRPYITEPAQPHVLKVWHAQLEKYISALRVA